VFAALGQRLAAVRTAATSGIGADTLEDWCRTYVAISSYESWQAHGIWIERQRPMFGPAIAGRWETARRVSPVAAAGAYVHKERSRAQVRALLGADGVAVLPSAASVAPLLNASQAEFDALRTRSFRITCIAGLGGLPQVSIPFLGADGLPFGVSLLGPAGSDRALVALAVSLFDEFQ
jgi:amidase